MARQPRAKSPAVDYSRDKTMHSREIAKDFADFLLCQHYRQAPRAMRGDDRFQPDDFLSQDPPVEEEQRVESLLLSGSRDFSLHREVGQVVLEMLLVEGLGIG
jgi:hypothetical protein